MPKRKKKTKKVMVKTNHLKNRIVIVLDSSTSMESMRDEAIGLFNEQADAILDENEDMDTRVSLITFATEVYEPEIWNEPVDKLGKINRETYVPHGWTAMYDAVGTAIDKLRALPEADDEDCSFLMVIISDGAENASKEYTSKMISSRIKKLQRQGNWTFTYLGANQDLSKVSEATGIHMDNMVMYTASAQGMNSANVTHTGGMKNYLRGRKIGSKASSNFYSGKKHADDPDPVTTTTTTTTTKK